MPPSASSLPDHRAIFSGFFRVGITAFGGALPQVRRMLVDDRRWLDDREFTNLLGMGQALPGPNVMNIAIAVGKRYRGLSGALSAMAGLLAAPMLIILSLAALYDRFAACATVQHVLSGLGAAAAGLMASMGIRLAMRMERRGWHLLVAGLTFAGAALLRLPLPAVLLPMALLATVFAWQAERRESYR